MKTWPGWLVVLAAACGVSGNARSTPTTSNQSPSNQAPASALVRANATVVRVIDGDTIDVDFERFTEHDTERIRLIGVDTPETMKPNTPIECYGPEASAFTHATLPAGTAVSIVRDTEARDDYGRLLGYVYRSSDGLFVNLRLVADGFARPLTIRPNDTFAAAFVAAAGAAEAADLGLWGACTG